jgi:hypothetical protein
MQAKHDSLTDHGTLFQYYKAMLTNKSLSFSLKSLFWIVNSQMRHYSSTDRSSYDSTFQSILQQFPGLMGTYG